MWQPRSTICLFLFLTCVLCSAVTHAADVYYSVGTNTGDLKAAATVMISGGNTATFSAPQPDNVGLGDQVTYNTSAVVYISGKISPTIYTVATALGEPVNNGGPWTVNRIARAFNHLNNAVNTSAAPNPSDALRLDTADLTSGPYTLNIICYGDEMEDTAAVTVNGWVSDAISRINIFPSDETRSKGKWDSGAYRLMVASGDAITIGSDHVTVSGLQIALSGTARYGIVASAGFDGLRIGNNIIRYSGANPPMAAGIRVEDNGGSGRKAGIWNNIIYDFLGTENAGISVNFSGIGSKAAVYNNTVYNNTVGLDDASGAGSIVAKNNLVYGNGDNYGGFGTFDPASTNNLSGPNSDAQIPIASARNGVTVQFMDAADGDLRLAANDASAKGAGTSLANDAGLPFEKDIEGQRRGRVWDIGADERAPRVLSVASATDPIVVHLGDGTVTEDLALTFTNAANGLNSIQKGGSGVTWGGNLMGSGTLFTIGGESGITTHLLLQEAAGEVVIRKTRGSVVSHYHIYPSGRIVLDARGASSLTVNQTSVFSEYAHGAAHDGGYHAYVDLLETAVGASDDYNAPDTALSVITGQQQTGRSFDYSKDGFEEGAGSYAVMAQSSSAVIDFNGAQQTRYQPVVRIEEFYPRTASSGALLVYWDAEDAVKNENEIWTGDLVSTLTPSTAGLRGGAMVNDSAGSYASLPTASNIADPGTLSLWVKSSSSTNPSANQYIFFAGGDFNLYFDSSGYLHFTVAAGARLSHTAADLYDGNWHEITCVWDYTEDTYALYTDGKLRASSSASRAMPALEAAMYWTAADSAGTNRFTGMIDEIRVYSGVNAPAGHVLFHSRLDAAADVTNPQVGGAGVVAGGVSFSDGISGGAISFDASGEHAAIPSAGNILASTGTLEMYVKSHTAANPSIGEHIFWGGPDLNIFFDPNGRLNFKISASAYLTDTADTYDGLWHHLRAVWDYTADKYFLYVDGRQAASSRASYNAPVIDETMYLGAADGSGIGRYNGMIDNLLIYDDVILPFGAFHVPDAWGDFDGKPDPSVLVYWDASSSNLNLGTGSATLGGSLAVGTGISGEALVNDASGDYASISSAGNIAKEQGSLAFWARSAGTDNPSGPEYLFYGHAGFNVFFDTSGYLNFTISNGVSLQHAADTYDAKWHFVRCTWDYTNGLFRLFVDGVKRDSRTGDYGMPDLDAALYVTAQDSAGTNRFSGILDEFYITNAANTPVTATAGGRPVMQPQTAMPYAYRMDIGVTPGGLLPEDLLVPFSGFAVSSTNSSFEYTIQFLGNITATGRPSLSGLSAVQNANTGNVTISFTGTDPDNDTVTYIPEDCEYSLDSSNGLDGTWNKMTTAETTENFTSAGAALSFIWDAAADTNVYDSTVYARLKVKDAIGHESDQAVSQVFSVDTAAPTGLGSFGVSGKSTTMIALMWDPVSDDSWANNARYEISYGTIRADVQNRGGTALVWGPSDDGALRYRTTIMTTITGLLDKTTYYFKIWAIDGYNNEATIADISAATAESVAERVYKVQIDPIYDAANKAILVTTSLLTRAGAIVTDLSGMTLTYVGVLDNAGTLLSGNLNGAGDTVSGTGSAIFYTTWDPSGGLSANTAYTVVARVSYKGQAYSGSKTFNVDKLGSLEGEVNLITSKTDILTMSVSGLDSQIDAVSEKIDTYEEVQAAFRETRTSSLTSMAAEVGMVGESTSAGLIDLFEEELSKEAAKGIHAEIITRSTTVVTGSTVPIRFRSASGLSPVITVYDPRNISRIVNSVMREVGGTSGIYSYDVTFNTSWGLGGFSVLVQEPANHSVGSIMIDVVSGSASGGSSGTTASSSISTDMIYSRLTGMGGNITDLVNGMSDVNTATMDVSNNIDRLLSGLNQARSGGPLDAETIRGIAGAIGVAIGEDDGNDLGTILGRLSGLEGMLAGIGADASIAASLTDASKIKAKFIRQIASRIQGLIDNGEIEEAEKELLILGESLAELRDGVVGVPGVITTDSIAQGVQATMDELNQIAAEKGIDGLFPLVETLGGGKAMDAQEIMQARNDVNELTSLMAEVKARLDQEINEPIIHAWFEGE